ncbi:hypothetical protein [Nannocystis bainbridge]|uniref:EF-hand domain-containing protein n=1 Tax=Nannocystis bainbridge TaxID=2995303 RepID=A0ABT5DZS2_9BACT|nr:hypothetical protein [Nannocystis bainbridge]MDC0717947.1 hypothetical protein [Nannocystis bainbridge]
MHKSLLSLSLLVALAGCDAAIIANQRAAEAEAEAEAAVAVATPAGGEAVVAVQAAPAGDGDAKVVAQADVAATLKPEALDLETVTYLIKKGKVKDADALEKKLNSPKEKLHSIDIDGDGKLDKIQIVEVKQGDTIVFELHALPSSKKDKDNFVIVGYVNFTADKTTNVLIVKATYAPVVIGYQTIVYDYTAPIVVKNDVVVVTGGGGFYGWLYAPRPVYVGVVVWEAPTVVIDVHHGGCWPPGHCKHHKPKHHKHKHHKHKHGHHHDDDDDD